MTARDERFSKFSWLSMPYVESKLNHIDPWEVYYLTETLIQVGSYYVPLQAYRVQTFQIQVTPVSTLFTQFLGVFNQPPYS